MGEKHDVVRAVWRVGGWAGWLVGSLARWLVGSLARWLETGWNGAGRNWEDGTPGKREGDHDVETTQWTEIGSPEELRALVGEPSAR
ncbi:MAG: hypothetical protein QOH68_1383, partial [Nocardioidaceae bacterium]|nr:hypothetical protein [Nocardioidaceae bacterium]